MDDREERVRRRLESGNFEVHEHFPKDVKIAVQTFLEASRMMVTEGLDYVPIEYLQKLLKLNDDEYILSLRTGKKVKKYNSWCESTEDYIDLLLTSKHYTSFQKELINQWFTDDIDVNKLVDTLDLYAEDVYYKDKIKKLIVSIERKLYE